MCRFSEGINKDPVGAAELDGGPDLSLDNLAALNRANGVEDVASASQLQWPGFPN